jgi:hypothetical protein
VKWATSLPWFQWNHPISVKKWSFSRPVSLFNSVFFSPIIILFLQYSHKMFLKFDPYRVWCSILYSKLVNCILFKIIVQHVRFVKCRWTFGSGERNVKIWIDFRKSPRFSLTSPLSQEREKSSRPVFTMCGEPWNYVHRLHYFSNQLANQYSSFRGNVRKYYLTFSISEFAQILISKETKTW